MTCNNKTAVVSKINKAKKYVGKTFLRKNMAKLKIAANRAFRRTSKHAIQSEREINLKPRLTSWHII